MMQVKNGLRFVGFGHYVPPRIVTNDDLSKIVDTNDEWITTRTGIKRRHFMEDEDTNLDLALNAAKMAIEDAGIDPQEIGAVVLATVRPDNMTPSVACMVQKALGLSEYTPSLDINAACSGFMYGLSVAAGFLMQSEKRYALVIGSETLSRVLDMTDRSTCILFGDGAGAAVIELSEEHRYFSVLGSRGNDEYLVIPNNSDKRYVRMSGGDVFKFAVSTVPRTVEELIAVSGNTAEDIDWFVCHQANKRIIELVAKRVGQSLDRFYMNLEDYGNTSSASIPIALSEMNQKGLLKEGMKLIAVGFGGGLTWGGAYIEL